MASIQPQGKSSVKEGTCLPGSSKYYYIVVACVSVHLFHVIPCIYYGSPLVPKQDIYITMDKMCFS